MDVADQAMFEAKGLGGNAVQCEVREMETKKRPKALFCLKDCNG